MNLKEILITPLAQIDTDGGNVFHVMKQIDVGYAGFGEAYFSWIAAGHVKAWKQHMEMTMNLVVPVGQIKFVFRLEGVDEFRIEEIGVDRYARITVPPGIWFGFQGLQEPQSLLLNIASITHNPKEAKRLALAEIKYDWTN